MTASSSQEADMTKPETVTTGVLNYEGLGPEFLAAVSTRVFSSSQRDLFLEQTGVIPSRSKFLKQIHGDRIVCVEDALFETEKLEADALVTDLPGIALGIRTADCLPVFFVESLRRVIGLAHAGWRGLAQGILENTVRKLKDRYGVEPAALRVWIGPAIQSCCYTVGPEFSDIFPSKALKPTVNGKYQMDLVGEACRRLEDSGVCKNLIVSSGICTVCRNDIFFSARAGQKNERIFSVLMLRSKET